jgi:hypothetical protein
VTVPDAVLAGGQRARGIHTILPGDITQWCDEWWTIVRMGVVA